VDVEGSGQLDGQKTDFLRHAHSYLAESIRFADAKAAVILTYSTALIAALYAAGLRPLPVGLCAPGHEWCTWLSRVAFALLCCSAIVGAWSVKPRLGSNGASGLIYCEDIAMHSSRHGFRDQIARTSANDLLTGLADHVFDLARVCRAKHRTILFAFWFLLIGSVVGGGALVVAEPASGRTEPIAIGVDLGLTGSLAKYGEWALTAMQIAADEVNRSGGIHGRRIKLLVEDSQSEPKGAVSAFRKLVDVERVPVVVGLIGSSEALACAPLANRTRTVLFSTGAASPEISMAGPFVFRNRVSGELEVRKLAEVARRGLHLSRVAILYINTDYGKSYADLFTKRFTALGGKVLLAESFQQGQTDFRTVLLKIRAAPRLDAVYLPTHITEGANILKQARELGLSVQFLASNAIEGPELIKIAGRAADGVIYTAPLYDAGSQSSAVERFDQEFKKRSGMHSEMFGAHAYDAIKILASVMRKADGNAIAVRNGLLRVKNYVGVSGVTTFDANGDVLKPIATKQVKGGRFVFVRF
jgi:branched-chain amino acid transport system substrate-binding protein